MENLIWDAVPAQRKRKEEKYNTPVVTMSAIDKPGAGRKFSFNKAAQEALGIQGEDRVSFGFAQAGNAIYIRKASGEAGFQLTKTCTLSDKRTYEFIAKKLNLDTTIESEFNVVSAENVGAGVFEMTIMEQSVVTFEHRDLGEISDEISDKEFDSDTYETGPISDLYSEAEVVEEEMAVMPEPQSQESNTEEDVW